MLAGLVLWILQPASKAPARQQRLRLAMRVSSCSSRRGSCSRWVLQQTPACLTHAGPARRAEHPPCGVQGSAEQHAGQDTTDESEEESSHVAHRTREILQTASQVRQLAQPWHAPGCLHHDAAMSHMLCARSYAPRASTTPACGSGMPVHGAASSSAASSPRTVSCPVSRPIPAAGVCRCGR